MTVVQNNRNCAFEKYDNVKREFFVPKPLVQSTWYCLELLELEGSTENISTFHFRIQKASLSKSNFIDKV